jgi:xanthine/uracil permease
VMVSGIKIFSMGSGFSRRNRFIISCALALGLGVTMVPQVWAAVGVSGGWRWQGAQSVSHVLLH